MTLRLLHLLFSPLKSMTALLDRIVGVIAGFQSREADLRQRLADALANNAADAASIDAARRDALAAMERAATAEALMAQLQASAIDAFIDLFVPALTESEANAEEEAAEPVEAVPWILPPRLMPPMATTPPLRAPLPATRPSLISRQLHSSQQTSAHLREERIVRCAGVVSWLRSQAQNC